MYVNDEEKSKLIWQPSDPVVLLWESGVSSISPELQFSEMDIDKYTIPVCSCQCWLTLMLWLPSLFSALQVYRPASPLARSLITRLWSGLVSPLLASLVSWYQDTAGAGTPWLTGQGSTSSEPASTRWVDLEHHGVRFLLLKTKDSTGYQNHLYQLTV